jgi:phosphatidate cytidylyltransferase
MADDDAQGGFDDWLEEEPGPVTDPYAALADEADDAESEIADWMAFTSGEGEDTDVALPAATPQGEEVVIVDITAMPGEDDATEEIEIASVPPSVGTSDGNDHDLSASEATSFADSDADNLDKVERIPIIKPPEAAAVPATTVDLDEFDSGARADTDEIPIIAGADIVAASVMHNDLNDAAMVEESAAVVDTGEIDAMDDASESLEGTAPMAMDAFADEPDDTGELEVIEFPGSDAPESADEIAGDESLDRFSDGADQDSDSSPGPSDGIFDLTQEGYHGAAATRDHVGLAAAIAEADAEDTEQVALTAPMAGLESSVVGFDDVVAAEGHGRVRARGSGDLLARVITAIVLIAALAASLIWRPALVALALAVFIIGAGEFYTALRRSGRHPIALFGFIGIVGATLGAYAWGAIAIPMSFFLVVTLLLLFYAVVPGKVEPMANLALTVSVMAWVGLGAYAMLIAVSDDYQTLVVGVVFAVAAMDIAQYFVGRALGRHQLSPWVSPKKTIEGLVGGVIVALTIGALLHFFPPFELTSGLAIGAATAVLVPLGDLAMSAAKRSLGLKDMGSILPGHGGFLDRIDGLIFVIPAAWAIFVWAGLL